MRVLGGVLTVPGWILDLGCGPVKDGVVATRLGARPPEPATDPISSLAALLSVPASVAAGTLLRYTVTLAPRGTADVVLQPCPNFLQALGTGLKDPHRLNCAGVRPVTAGGGETFAMQLMVPATTAPGQMTLTWFLGLPGGASAAGPAVRDGGGSRSLRWTWVMHRLGRPTVTYTGRLLRGSAGTSGAPRGRRAGLVQPPSQSRACPVVAAGRAVRRTARQTSAGVSFRDTEFMQKRSPVGVCGASSKTWPRWLPQLAHRTSTRRIPRVRSSMSSTLSLSVGA